ncbi:MAG: efflux RND transporter periplasmic adaptor subunit [Thermodesulfobacteriota bacterium]
MFDSIFRESSGRLSRRQVVAALVALVVLAGAIYLLARPGGNGGGTGGTPGRKTGERTILFYRNPMNPAITSPTPAKDEMGMDYLPVYEDEGNAPPKSMEQEVEDFFAEEDGAGGGAVEGLVPVVLSARATAMAGVRTAPAVSGPIYGNIRTVGRVMADERLVRQVQTRAAGWVEQLVVQSAGQMVEKGAPILSLYSPELFSSQEEFLQAGDTARKLAKSPDPETRKFGRGLEQAAIQRLKLFDVPEAFIAELAEKRQPVRAVTLVAPLSGFVMLKEVFAGQQVSPGMLLFEITDLSRIWVEADFYESDGTALKSGQEAVIRSPYDPALELTGRVDLVYPFLDPESRTIKVRLEFPNESLALKPGMYVDVDLRLDFGPGISIPESAVLDSGTRKVVFIDKGNGRFEPREVVPGARSNGGIQILKGVAPGERVAVTANFLLDSESRLQAVIQEMMKK